MYGSPRLKAGIILQAWLSALSLSSCPLACTGQRFGATRAVDFWHQRQIVEAVM